ncbi:MFS transporter [Corynebacterium poyangense]|uniref:MFS transporter n=1 Tax=Corynebacterium poyangense TaxID=2684405 RepID=A0A7H0SNI9_9CORY|nr:glycoside-pentoside-hexuronide (GPH):cation symporter [Corynebacterium poyangense]MBZ8177147.1 MFS transporter [Corynebacterium poyangense]QNQ90114.1 MFS transporter [Corynebacterium poyangense]
MATHSSPTAAVVSSGPHLPVHRLVGYGLGDAGCNIAFQMTGLFLLVFYTNVVGIRPEHSGLIFLFIKVWDAFADIFAGRVVDATMTRWGKFRPFLLWYSIPLLASNLLCFWIPVSDYGMKVIWATVSYALMGLLYSMVNIPYGSLAGAMSQDPVDRSRMAAARMVGSGFTILILAVLLAPAIKSAANLQQTFLITAIAFLIVGSIFFMTTFATAKEVVEREVERVSLKETLATVRRNGPLMRLCGSSLMYLTGQNVVSAMALYIAIDLLGRFSDGNWQSTVVTIITTGAVLYMSPFGPILTRKLGKKRGFLVAGIASIIGVIIFWAGSSVTQSLSISLLGLFVTGAGMAILNTMTWALEADTVEYGEYRTGIRTEGATYAAFSFTRKVGQGIGMALASWALALSGYVQPTSEQKAQGISHLAQDPATLDAMGLWFAIFAGGFFLLAILIMWSYPLTEKRFGEIMASIEKNRTSLAAKFADDTEKVVSLDIDDKEKK